MDEDQGLVSSKDTPRSSTLFAAHSQKTYENIALCTKNIKQLKAKPNDFFSLISLHYPWRIIFAILEKIFCSCAS